MVQKELYTLIISKRNVGFVQRRIHAMTQYVVPTVLPRSSSARELSFPAVSLSVEKR